MGSVKECQRCGCLTVDIKTHRCSEEMVHAYEIGPHVPVGEWRAQSLGMRFVWAAFEQWLGTPKGKFASFLVKRSYT